MLPSLWESRSAGRCARSAAAGLRTGGSRLTPWFLVAAALCSCSPDRRTAGDPPHEVPANGQPRATVAEASVALVEVAAESGVDFTHDNGAAGAYLMPEIMAGGVAVFDADGDTDLDLYLVQSGAEVPPPRQPARNAPDRFYRNLGDGRFQDDTTGSGLGDPGYGMGAAVGDIDNDGDVDLFVSNYGPDSLWRNEGGGRFLEVTAEWGLGDPEWSASAVFCDFDRDGWLDLFVTRYVDFDAARECAQQGGRRDYCGPTVFPGLHDLLYRNLGGRRFADVSIDAGIASVADAGLGVVCEDVDDDGWPDFYVANDADPNHLWINQRDGTFVDDAMLLGSAFNRLGSAEAGMGVVAADADADGALDLLVTNLIEETNTFYRNLGPVGFEDATAAAGLGVGSMDLTGFGVALFDLENDGDLDAAIVNGAVKRRPAPWAGAPGGFWLDYAEPNLLFLNDGAGAFSQAAAAPFTGDPAVSRALVPADLDADGDLDLVVTVLDGPARLYRNDGTGGGNAGSWIAIEAFDPRLGRLAIGAEVTVHAGGRTLVRRASSAGGYLSGTGAAIHLGLGAAEEVTGFVVRWPQGDEESFPGGPSRRRVRLVRGEGKPSRAPDTESTAGQAAHPTGGGSR